MRRLDLLKKEWKKPFLCEGRVITGVDIKIDGEWLVLTATDGKNVYRMDLPREELEKLIKADREEASLILLSLKGDICDVGRVVKSVQMGKS